MKRLALAALLLGGCAPLSRVHRLETENYELERTLRSASDAYKVLQERLARQQAQLDQNAELIKQAIYIQSICAPEQKRKLR